LFAKTLRSEDVAVRYGGDEFVCVLPGADLDQAAMVAGGAKSGDAN
jgi:diguanylate cyclase (GGDEF)-like protein